MSPKNHLPVNLKNCFENVMVIEINQIAIHESQVHAPSNLHKLSKITNTKSQSLNH